MSCCVLQIMLARLWIESVNVAVRLANASIYDLCGLRNFEVSFDLVIPGSRNRRAAHGKGSARGRRRHFLRVAVGQ